MRFERQGGILMHPSSLPGPYGIGSLGRHALEFIDQLADAGAKIWQILPLGPTGYGDSPYQCFSAYAGNPYLVDLDLLMEEGLLRREELWDVDLPADHVDFGALIPFKMDALRKAFENFKAAPDPDIDQEFNQFCRDNASWLDDYALFRAVKDTHQGRSWLEWPEEVRTRQPQTMDAIRQELAVELIFQQFIQFLFFRQWNAVKAHANSLGIQVLGDIPLYVSLDSAEAWTRPELFQFDEDLRPVVVAGVPPDYFSETGQLWGNPIFDWEAMEADGFQWWKERIEGNLRLYDILRIDHFRGLEAFWAVPFGEDTAINGEWVKAPGMQLFEALSGHFPDLPLVAEDLGVITDEVNAIRETFGLPGMKILQFAFDSSEDNEYIPHTYEKNTVVYTGTHDNDTVLGWAHKASADDRDYMLAYLDTDGGHLHWDLIRLAWASVAALAIVPMQDILGKGSEARMNLPGTAGGNWTWRMQEGELQEEHISRLAELTKIYGR